MRKFWSALALFYILLSANPFALAADSFASSINFFNWHYFSTLNHKQNIFYSPYGIAAALSIVANGSTGETQNEILSALSCWNVQSLNLGFKNFRDYAALFYSNSTVLREANLLLVNDKLTAEGFYKNFRRAVQLSFGAQVASSHHFYKIDANAHDNSFVLLLNRFSFMGKWAFPFFADNTGGGGFREVGGKEVRVPTMNKNFRYNIPYYADEKYRGIAIPYEKKGGETIVALYVILAADGALDVAQRWSDESVFYKEEFLAQIEKAPTDYRVSVWLPKFEFDTKTNLVESLQAVGIKRAFTSRAEISGVVRGAELMIDNAIHQAKVKVDEEGTTAAVTEIIFTTTTDRLDRIVEFRVDRPFIFVIRDEKSGLNLFTGAVNKLS